MIVSSPGSDQFKALSRSWTSRVWSPSVKAVVGVKSVSVVALDHPPPSSRYWNQPSPSPGSVESQLQVGVGLSVGVSTDTSGAEGPAQSTVIV